MSFRSISRCSPIVLSFPLCLLSLLFSSLVIHGVFWFSKKGSLLSYILVVKKTAQSCFCCFSALPAAYPKRFQYTQAFLALCLCSSYFVNFLLLSFSLYFVLVFVFVFVSVVVNNSLFPRKSSFSSLLSPTSLLPYASYTNRSSMRVIRRQAPTRPFSTASAPCTSCEATVSSCSLTISAQWKMGSKARR